MYKKQKKSWVKHWDFLLVDIICLEIAFFISYLIRLSGEPESVDAIQEYYSKLAVVLLLAIICVTFFFESYSGILRRNKLQELTATITNCSVISMVLIVYIWLTKQGEIYSRQIVLVFWAMSLPFAYLCRCLLKRLIRYQMIHNKAFNQLLVITEDRYAAECITSFQHTIYKEFEITGLIILDKNRTGEMIGNVPVVASMEDCLQYICGNVVDEVFINTNTKDISEELASELLELGVTVHFNLVPASALRPNKIVERCGQYMVLTSSMKIATNRQLFIKRTMDIAGSIIGLLFTGIAFLIFAPIIKLQSRGPVFYSQTRIGKNGRPFKIYKFRTMIVGADAMQSELMRQNEMEGHMFKMKDDPRIFGIGRFMRKFSIDELPQFFNVLKGEMSLVGTRPPTEEEFTKYDPHHKARLSIKPGLTGMWQVSGRNEIRDFEEIVRLDTQYISNWSLGMDFRIICKTILVVLSGKGS